MKKTGKKRPRKRFRRFLLGVLGLYMVLGYMTASFDRVEVTDGPPPSLALPTNGGTLLSGVFSVHTGRSHDARGEREDVAAAAVAAGLDFVVVGDHGPDGRRPDWAIWAPQYLDGVLVDGGVELRAPEAGKVLAMGVDSAYQRWEGDMASFVEFLSDQEATSMIVHARGPKENERWVHPGITGVQGLEVLDISEAAEARLGGPWGVYHVLTLLAGYPFGLGDEALLHAMRDGFETPTVAAYDSLRGTAPLTATAGLNVHPKLRMGSVLFPAYEPFFHTLVSHLMVEDALPPDPVRAQGAISDGVRKGDLFISLGHREDARRFRLAAVSEVGDGGTMGSDVPLGPGVVLRGGFEGDPGRNVVYRILRDGSEVEWIRGPELEWEPPGPGVYRVEVYSYGAGLGGVFFRLRPWIFANPIGLLAG